MNGTGRPGGHPGRLPRGLWWAWPTAAALLGASVVSLLLVPGSVEHTAVPEQILITRAHNPQSPAPDGRHGSRNGERPRATTTPTPTTTRSPDDTPDEPTVVVTPSRHIESESAEDEHEVDDHGDRR